jgi:hypothetical protein
MKRILVIIRGPLDGPLGTEKAAQGLRATVAYAALDLDVMVALCGAEPASATKSDAVSRPLLMLRALGRTVVSVDAEALCALLTESTFDTVIVW